MDTQSLRSDLMKWLSELNDVKVLNELKAIRDGQDWSEQISNDERSAIEEGLSQLDNDQMVSHELVLKERQEKYGI